GSSRVGRTVGRSSRRAQDTRRSRRPNRTTSSPSLGMKLVERRLFIAASPTRVYELLTDAHQLMEWMAPHAEVDPQPGGALTWTHAHGHRVIAPFVALVPARRIVFTYGWDREDVRIPPGSTTVEINLRPHDRGTELHLVHRGLAGPLADAHRG